MLDDWLADNENRLFILRALGGFGKSALAWQWINIHVDPAEWTKLVWWSFYEGDASFEHFIEETLKSLKLDVPQGLRPQVDELLKTMQRQKILLVMDGFERALRAYSSMNAAYQGDDAESPSPAGRGDRGEGAYDCVNINAEIFLKSVCSLPNIKSKVLMTTRLTPRVVKPRGESILGCREVELTAMQEKDAVEFFRRQKIKGTHAEIEAACAPYGYHPLSLRILAGLITNDREKPADVVVADNLNITNDIIQNKNHVLKVSYDSLSFAQQRLLSNMACFRSSISYQALKVITSKPSWKRKNKSRLNEKLNDSLQILEARGLLNWDRVVNKYDLHPIVRRYAYERLSAPDRTAAHSRLCGYFDAVDVPEHVKTLDDLAPVIELYYHTVKAGKLDEAADLLANHLVPNPLHFQFGAYQLMVELERSLFPDGEDKLPRLKRDDAQAWTLNSLANAYALNGQPHRATPLFEMMNYIHEHKIKNKENLAVGLANVASMTQLHIGALNQAEQNLRQSIDLSQEVSDKMSEAYGNYELARIYCYEGIWPKAEQGLNIAQDIFERSNHSQALSLTFSYRALYFLINSRDDLKLKIVNLQSAIGSASRALEQAEERHKNISRPNIRDYIRAYWLLGAAYRANGELNKAEENLSKAISLCRQINNVESEAYILLDLARLRYDQKNYEEARSLAEEALTITRRCGYVLQGADVNLFLAQYALEQEKDKAKAREYAETALKLAYCDGPPYHYKVAYEEAERMLVRL